MSSNWFYQCRCCICIKFQCLISLIHCLTLTTGDSNASNDMPTRQWNVSWTQSASEQATFMVSATVNSTDTVKVAEAVGGGESLTPQITSRQVDIIITTLHICHSLPVNNHQWSWVCYELSEQVTIQFDLKWLDEEEKWNNDTDKGVVDKGEGYR